MKKKQVDFVHVPGYFELSVKNLWKDLKNDQSFNVYFQDKYAEDKVPCRKYFFDILNTIYPQYLDKLLKHASKQRFTIEGDEAKKEAIVAIEEWLEELKNLPFKSCKYLFVDLLTSYFIIEKNGKTLYLLK